MQKSRVLIVDDEADIRELLSLTLQRMGLDTDCAATEFEAVQLLQKHGYDLCLTDMRLPDGDGLEAARARRQALSRRRRSRSSPRTAAPKTRWRR